VIEKGLSNGGIDLIKQNIHMSAMPTQPPRQDYQYILERMKDRKVKTGPVQEWVSVEEGRVQGEVKEGEYGGYISYSFMKTEQ
jgi:hypothetical protein